MSEQVGAATSDAAMESEKDLKLELEFSGGTELLLAPPHKTRHTVHIPAIPPVAESSSGSPTAGRQPADMRFLIDWIRRNMIKEREELFVAEGSVRPGILVLINNTDWELEGELEYELQDGDEVVFISTLHGG